MVIRTQVHELLQGVKRLWGKLKESKKNKKINLLEGIT